MDTIERIKAEIERLKKEQLANNNGKMTGSIKIDAGKLENFLDALEKVKKH